MDGVVGEPPGLELGQVALELERGQLAEAARLAVLQVPAHLLGVPVDGGPAPAEDLEVQEPLPDQGLEPDRVAGRLVSRLQWLVPGIGHIPVPYGQQPFGRERPGPAGGPPGRSRGGWGRSNGFRKEQRFSGLFLHS